MPRRDRHDDLAAARREADGVLEEVRQYLVDLNRVGWHIGRIPQDRPDAHATQHRLHPVEDGRHNLVDRRGLLHRNERAGTDPRELENVADQTVQTVGLFQHRPQQLVFLIRVEPDVVLQETRHRRLDGGERRSQVVCDRGKQRRARLASLDLDPRVRNLLVQPSALEHDGDLARCRLEQSAIVSR